VDEERNFGDWCVEPERFEMGLEDAEQDGFLAGGSGDGELAFVHGALVEAQLEVEGRGGAVQEAEARAQLFEQSVQGKEERRRRFNGRFEGERQVQGVGKGFNLKNAFAGVAGHFPERVDFWSEPFANVLTREGEEFSEGGETPFGEVLKEGRREVEFGEAEGGNERGRVINDEDGICAASSAEGEGGLRGDAEASVDADAGVEAAESGVCPSGPIVGWGVEAGEVEEPAVSVRLFFDAGREGFREAEEVRLQGMFGGGRGGEEEQCGATGDGLGGGHAGVESVSGGVRIDFEEGAIGGGTFEHGAGGGRGCGRFFGAGAGSWWCGRSGWSWNGGVRGFPEDGLETKLGDDEEGITPEGAAMDCRGGHGARAG
jgi:hypothetical protein